MPAKPATEKALHARLLDGFEVKARPDGTVHTIRANGQVVGEVCVGKSKVRLNLRDIPAKGKAPRSIVLGGHSKSWAGGGIIVTEANLTAARALLAAVAAVKPAKPAKVPPTASDAARVSVKATAETQTARKRVARVGRRSGVKVTAA